MTGFDDRQTQTTSPLSLNANIAAKSSRFRCNYSIVAGNPLTTLVYGAIIYGTDLAKVSRGKKGTTIVASSRRWADSSPLLRDISIQDRGIQD
ncbi:hypothetical protein HYALB_00004055 [Hymenoscyphus albidus]|uniref:Uncharacterized protein n=1 Tax=Hymenoscyphus albidus TaxID=595503 RepID=A0A9N9M329_9HELO|nr:hypothetical protein HYALB_00004055 [Hymenoscyphus albidus]